MAYDEDFLSITADALSDMRVLVAGAISIFEDDTPPIIQLCSQHQEHDACTTLSDIGGALYNLRREINELQDALRRASEQNPKEEYHD